MMKGLGKSILGALVEFDDAPPVTAPQAATPAAKAATPITTAPATAVYQPANVVDPEMIETLNKVIAARKTPYTALVEKADILKSAIADDNARFKAAFSLISAEGRTLDTVIQAIDVHSTDLDGELMRFKKSSEGAIAQKVTGPRQRIQAIAENKDATLRQIATLQQQIASLNDQITNNDLEAQRITQETAAAEAEINAVQTRFATAVEYVRNDLASKKAQLAAVLTA